MVDDDEYLPEHAVASLFSRWRHDPDRLVGVVGRSFLQFPSVTPKGTRVIQYVYPKNCCAVHEQFLAGEEGKKALAVCTQKDRGAAGGGGDGGAGDERGGSSRVNTGTPSWCADAALNHGLLTMDDFCDTQRLVLPKGMFFHRKYMKLYSDRKHSKLRS
jgi:hypothetical protein